MKSAWDKNLSRFLLKNQCYTLRKCTEHIGFIYLASNLNQVNSKKMKKTLLSVITLTATLFSAQAQNFSPAGGSTLAGGTLNQAYAGQVLTFTVPATADINTSVLGSPISIPGVPIPIPNPNLDLSAAVTNVTWAVEGLPNGLTAVCDASPCTYVSNAGGTITISGTPTEAGVFTINITSLTNGSATLPAPISQTIAFPQAVPTVLDESGYTMTVVNPNGIAESNGVFSLGLYPNPTEGLSTLDVNSTIAGMATIEVYSITGALIQTSAKSIRVGANRLNLDLTAVPAGIYLVKSNISGHQALIRTQKK